MDIVVKSFNRVYLLDRCLSSIQKFVLNFEGNIIIIDDGTPEKYLKKINQKYPQVVIKKTKFYDSKSSFIEGNKKDFIKQIPIDSWLETVSKASDYFLLLEDDMWFSSAIDYKELNEILIQEEPLQIKLFWLGNKSLIASKKEKKNHNYVTYIPKLISKSPFFYKLLLFFSFKLNGLNSFINTTLSKVKLNYYSIYSVAGAVFKKEYFLSLWKDNDGSVDEYLQLINALNYIQKSKNAVFVRTTKEVLKTTFISSATNFEKKYENEIDMFEFNATLNDAWEKDQINLNHEFSTDVSINEIENFLIAINKDIGFITKWKNWVFSFKKQFEEIGCKID